jgi:predicted RNase H-like HicB family nuclease
MNTLRIVIEKSTDFYDAYAENCEGVYGAGETVELAKANVLEGIELLKKTKSFNELPDILKEDYQVIFHFDTKSFLNYYNKVFSNVALERLTGINQKLLHHYASGLRTPRDKQRKKIEQALHNLGRELLAIEL